MDCSLPGSSVHGVFQARILEWGATPSPGDLPNSGIKPVSLVLAGGFFIAEPQEKFNHQHRIHIIKGFAFFFFNFYFAFIGKYAITL